MIITQKQAEDRLVSGRNRLRDPSLPVPVREVIERDKEETQEPTEIRKADKSEKLLDMSALDAIVGGGKTRGIYSRNLEAQVAIAETSLILGPEKTSLIFGNSKTQVDAYEHGLRSNNENKEYNKKPELKKRIDAVKEVLAEKAAHRLAATLDLLTDEKLEKIKKATNLSKVGKDMAFILDKVTPKDDHQEGGVHFHIYRPETNVEQNYQVVKIGSVPESPVE